MHHKKSNASLFSGKLNFESDPLAPLIIRSVLPLLVAQLLNLLYNIVDRIYIARIPHIGHIALAGVGLCFPIISIIAAFANLFCSGGASLFAIAWGENRKDKAEILFNTSFYLNCFGSLILMAVCFLFSRPILIAFAADEEMMKVALPYLRIYLLGTFFSMTALGLNPFFSAQGRFSTGMLSVMIGAFSNLILDPIFIFVFGLGVPGAAIATIISQFLSGTFALKAMHSKNSEWKIQKFRKEFMNRSIISSILGLGTAGFIMQVTNSLVQIFSNKELMILGGSLYLAVLTIINSVRQMSDIMVGAIADGCSPILSYCYGAGLNQRVRKVIKVMTFVLCSYTAIMWILILIFPQAFIQLFDSDKALLKIAIPALKTYFFAYLFQALQYSGQTVFKALNQKKQAVFFSIFRKVVIVLPLIYILPKFWQPAPFGVFASEPVSNVIGGLACFITMLLTVYRRIPKDDKKANA